MKAKTFESVTVTVEKKLDISGLYAYFNNKEFAMTGWNILNAILNSFSPVVATVMLIVTGVLFLIGFYRHGLDFLKHGMSQNYLNDLLAKLATKEDIAELKGDIAELRSDMDGLRTEMDGLRTEMDGFRGELDTIKVNHFGHLKNFLTELTSILVDKGIINNENKARLDNQLRGM